MFDKPEYFFNRELSWLKFNNRVLSEAGDTATPLLERLRFIAITASNLDEFFMIRVAGLKHQLESGINKTDAAGLTVAQQLERISETAHELVKNQYKQLRTLIPALCDAKLCLRSIDALSPQQQEWLDHTFHRTIYPVLTPLGVDASHPFPFLANRSLNLAVQLTRPDEDEPAIAIIPVPSVLPRLLEVPFAPQEERHFLFLEDIIAAYCSRLFQGYTLSQPLFFRITRNADMFIDEDEAEDLLEEVESALKQRKRGPAVRLEVSKHGNKELQAALQEELDISGQDIYEINGPLDTTCFFRFADISGAAHLRHAPYQAPLPAALAEAEDIFAAIRQSDILLHHPYESFEPVVDFIRQAALDPQVLAIKQTLYRVSGNSPIVRALMEAAENGKQVTVLVELKARFDEENNIQWAKRLEEAGAHVIYGLMGLKTHSKIALVVRQEEDGICRYVHLGTGNYNDSTARIYTDLGLFTANDAFGADASSFFNMLSGYSDPPVWNKFIVAPLNMRERFYELVDEQIAAAQNGQPAHISAKMNSLIDKGIILKLYEASAAGVSIDLIIRGICGLRPGIPGVSDNITVRSIVGRFLEHHRIFIFGVCDEAKVYLSSADWMPRNLNERVELLFPIDDIRHAARIRAMFSLFLKDGRKAHVLRSDGVYRRVDKKIDAFSSQDDFCRQAHKAAQKSWTLEQRLQPMQRKDT